MKKTVRLFVVTMLLTFVAVPMFSVCGGPLRASTTEYWQFHQSCGVDPKTGWRICTEYWSLDGECSTDCDGSTSCWGDTQVRWRTDTYTTYGEHCDITCYPEY